MQIKTDWDLSPLLASDDAAEVDSLLAESQKQAHAFAAKYREDVSYLSDVSALKQALDELEAYERTYNGSGKVGYYYSLRKYQDQEDPKIKAKCSKIQDFDVETHNSLLFFTLKLAKISKEKQAEFLIAPELITYKHFLEKLFESAQYTLSEAEEKILTLESYTSYTLWESMVSELLSSEQRDVLDTNGAPKTMSFNEILPLTYNFNKEVRTKAAEAVNDIYNNHAVVAQTELNAILHTKKVTDQLRNYPRPDLDRHLSDDISSDVVDALISTVKESFELSHRFYNLKTRLLKLEKLTYFEKSLAVGKLEKKYSLEEAIELTAKVFNQLDPEFSREFAAMVSTGKFDFLPKKGKSGGGFCASGGIDTPSYILMNFTGTVRDVTTFAHETGHALNNYFMAKERHALDFDIPMSTAEVASTFFEDFVFEELSKTISSQDKLVLQIKKIEEDISSVFRQVACYLFEQSLHKDYREHGFVSKERIGELFKEHMSAYLGPSVDMAKGSENWWMYWSHIRNYFYVYSYASGTLIAKNLQSMVHADLKNIEKVKKFLGMGTSESPATIFAKLGIDISAPAFWREGLEQIDKDVTTAEELFSQQN